MRVSVAVLCRRSERSSRIKHRFLRVWNRNQPVDGEQPAWKGRRVALLVLVFACRPSSLSGGPRSSLEHLSRSRAHHSRELKPTGRVGLCWSGLFLTACLRLHLASLTPPSPLTLVLFLLGPFSVPSRRPYGAVPMSLCITRAQKSHGATRRL